MRGSTIATMMTPTITTSIVRSIMPMAPTMAGMVMVMAIRVGIMRLRRRVKWL